MNINAPENCKMIQAVRKDRQWIVKWTANKVFVLCFSHFEMKKIAESGDFITPHLEQLYKIEQLRGVDLTETVFIETCTAQKLANYGAIRDHLNARDAVPWIC